MPATRRDDPVKMTLEEIRSVFIRYYPDITVRNTVLQRMAETIKLVDRKPSTMPRRWSASCWREPERYGAIVRMNLSTVGSSNRNGIWTMAICSGQLVKFLVDTGSEGRMLDLNKKLQPLGGRAVRGTEGKELTFSCQVEIPAGHLATGYELIRNDHKLMMDNDCYGIRDIPEATNTWEKDEPAFRDYLRQELQDFGEIPEPEGRSPVAMQHSLFDEVAEPPKPDSQGSRAGRSETTQAYRDIPQRPTIESLPGDGKSRFIPALIDAAEHERKVAIHEYVVAVLCAHITEYGAHCSKTQLIDVCCFFGQTAHIFEVKYVDEANELEQYRKALAQLYEYRHWQSRDDPTFREATLWMVLSRPLTEQWLVDYLLADRQINVLWIENNSLSGPSYNDFVAAAESARA